MCQLKQSTKQIFFTSASAQECRDRVKELNASRGELENRKSEQLLESQSWQESRLSSAGPKRKRPDEDGEPSYISNTEEEEPTTSLDSTSGSRWSKYLVDDHQ